MRPATPINEIPVPAADEQQPGPASNAAASNKAASNRSRNSGFQVVYPPEKNSFDKFRLSAILWFAGMLLLSVPMVTLIDIPIARWFASEPLPRDFRNGLELMRIFSHGSGVFLVLLGIFLMAPQSRWHLPRLATMAIGAGAIATLAKMFVLRPRPTGLNLDVATIDSAWLWAFDWTLSQVATFDASTRAFPSGNMATAMALTVGLWFVVPRGRILFVMICLGTVLQRMASMAHFPSDILGGAAFGLIWAYVCLHPTLLGNLFDKMQPESEPRRRRRTVNQDSTGVAEGPNPAVVAWSERAA